jgi:DNA excision repair protein ERCC-1
LVDVEENYRPALLFLNKLATQHRLSLLLSWSEEEAARYLETFKAFESKDASLIQKKDKDTFADQLTDVICTVRSVNKTDVSQLLSQLGSFRSIAMADMDELSLIPGMCPANSSSYSSKTFLLHVYRFYFFLFLFY